MRSIVASAGLAGALVLLAGCDTTSPVVPYSASTQNVMAFQSVLKPAGQTVRVGDFTASGVETPKCRMAGALDVTSGKPIEQYIKDALQTELFTAQVYDANSSVIINGHVDQLKVNTFGTGSWTIGLQVSSNSDPTGYHVETTRTFATSFSAMAACQNATNAFMPAVQDLIGKVVSNPGFVKLLGKGS